MSEAFLCFQQAPSARWPEPRQPKRSGKNKAFSRSVHASLASQTDFIKRKLHEKPGFEGLNLAHTDHSNINLENHLQEHVVQLTLLDLHLHIGTNTC